MLDELEKKLTGSLDFIYPDIDTAFLARQLIETMGLDESCRQPQDHQNNWDESDILLITYADSILNPARKDEKPLVTLYNFLKGRLQDRISSVHILPFFPYSSDDGFSVMDYLAVNESHGEWEDIKRISSEFKFMSDLVINHMSSRSRWFDNFKKRIDPGKDYFFEANPDADVSAVVRPRTSPLLNAVQTEDGERYVWCTFSEDQVDLNFKNPKVLLEFVNIIRHYLEYGVQIFRLDAVAFLWKEVGTPSIHLQQTHEIIKLLRLLIEYYNPQAVIITETKNLQTQMQGKLSCIGVKCCLFFTNFNQFTELAEHLAVVAVFIFQLLFQQPHIPLTAINGAITARIFQLGIIIFRAQQTVNVKSRYTFQGQHNRMGTNKPLQLPLIRPVRSGTLKSIVQTDVHLIGFIKPLPRSTAGNTAAELLHGTHQLIFLFFLQQAVRWT